MPSAQHRKNRDWVAKQPGARELSPESRAATLAFPDLHLRVWCNINGVNVLAYIDSSDSKGRLCRMEIQKALFHPREVTPELVVEWGRRALARWLEDRALAQGEAQPTDA